MGANKNGNCVEIVSGMYLRLELTSPGFRDALIRLLRVIDCLTADSFVLWGRWRHKFGLHNPLLLQA